MKTGEDQWKPSLCWSSCLVKKSLRDPSSGTLMLKKIRSCKSFGGPVKLGFSMWFTGPPVRSKGPRSKSFPDVWFENSTVYHAVMVLLTVVILISDLPFKDSQEIIAVPVLKTNHKYVWYIQGLLLIKIINLVCWQLCLPLLKQSKNFTKLIISYLMHGSVRAFMTGRNPGGGNRENESGNLVFTL